MSLEKAQKLLTTTRYGETRMVVPRCGISLIQGTCAAEAMYRIIQDEYVWSWPNQTKHLKTWKDDRGECEAIILGEETEAEFEERVELWNTFPERETREQAEWLRCALIASRALRYLYEVKSQGHIKELDYIMPEQFYGYVLICLSQGQGEDFRKTKYSHPSKDEVKLDRWYVAISRQIVIDAIRDWERGIDLAVQFPLWTLEEAFTERHDRMVKRPRKDEQEVAEEVTKKIKLARRIVEGKL